MPYKNIVFVKLEKRLNEDPRWWTMSNYSQLLYIKLMLQAAVTYNKIPSDENVLRRAVRCELSTNEFKRCLDEVLKNFPKIRKNKHFMYFEEFETKTNWINPKELPRNSQGTPKDAVDIDIDIDKEIDKEKEKKHQVSDSEFLETLKQNPAYKKVDIDVELGKMDAWILARPGKKKTRRFIVNWLNRADVPVDLNGAGRKPGNEKWKCFVCSETVQESKRREHMDTHKAEVAAR